MEPFAMQEEIGNPALFVGRVQELDDLCQWAELSKRQLSRSRAILARRKKGKTALLQRFYNILYAKNDPQLVPFYFRIQERDLQAQTFALKFYCSFLGQYLAFQKRDVKLADQFLDLETLIQLTADQPAVQQNIKAMQGILNNSPALAWEHARDAPHRIASLQNIRIVQLIDEFQYLNRFIYGDLNPDKQENLCYSYMGTAESKVAPMIVTGSYIGWLEAIINHMTNRFEAQYLTSLQDDEALATVYNYATLLEKPITEETAPYIAELAHNDPFYISQIIRTRQPGHHITTKAGVRAAIQYETTADKGFIAQHWMEYVNLAFDRVNEINAKRLVLFLARHGEQEFSRTQLQEQLKLGLSDSQLQERLDKLYMADIIGRGSSFFRYKGLGDPIFAMVFRKAYGEEIERLAPAKIAAEIDRQMTQTQRQTAWRKGLVGEYMVRYHLMMAAQRGIALDTLVFNPIVQQPLTRFVSMNKERISTGTESFREVDIYARAQASESIDLVVEVKNWQQPPNNTQLQRFIQLKDQLQAKLQKTTGFLLYSEAGFKTDQETLMQQHGIMYTHAGKLTAYEHPT